MRRLRQLCASSTVIVLFFKLLIESVYEHLLGLLPDRLWRKTENYWMFPLGMFGRPTARHRTTRLQNLARSSCFLWWNANQVVCCVVTKHLTAPQHRILPLPLILNYEAPTVPSKSNPESILKYLERVYATISRCGVHGHFPICHEGKVA